VGQREVDEVERGARRVAVDAAQEAAELTRAVLKGAAVDAGGLARRGRLVARVAEVRERRVHLGELVLEVPRREQAQRDDAEIVGERPHAILRAAAVAGPADALRAERGGGLLHVQVVAAPQQREQVARVVRSDRQRPAVRLGSREHGRDGALGGVVDPRGVRVPRRPARERGEARIAPCVDAAVGPDERGARQLVEDHHHHRCAVAAAGGRGGHVVLREHQLGHGREEQEARQEQQRGGGQHRDEGPHRRDPRVEGGQRDGSRDREGQRRRGPQPGGHVLERLCRDRRHENSDECEVDAAPHSRQPSERELDGREQRRREQREPEGEQQDVAAGVAASDEELGCVAEHVEERLRDGERPEHGQVRPGHSEGPARRRLCHRREPSFARRAPEP
jgi:hypothetical protein